MKARRNISLKRGFTLMELMVAMAITTIIVTVLVSITSIALDTWNRSRAELRAARQAKAMVETMARDFESLVTRSGNENEWLSAESPQSAVGNKMESTNSADLIFFSAATDRYDGEIGGAKDLGGDVSCVAYRLAYRDPIDQSSTNFQTFVLNRVLVNPDVTFEKLLGKTDLEGAFNATSEAAKLDEVEYFVCENVFQFTVTFHVEISRTTGSTTKLVPILVTVGQSNGGQMTKEFKVKGTGIEAGSVTNATDDELKSGRLSAVEISLTVISDFGIDQLRNRSFSGTQESEFMAKNSYQYSKLIQLPSM